MYRVSHVVTRFAVFLLAGAAIALVWANLAPHSYADFVEYRLGDHFWVGYPNPDGSGPFAHVLTLGYLTGNVLMSGFLFFLGKELWEALVLPHGSLRGRQAVAPALAALGAALLPALVYAGFTLVSPHSALPSRGAGWPVVMAGDVALSYLVGRRVLGAAHPALRFLLLICIADDVLALLVTGLAFPLGALRPEWLGLSLAAVLVAWIGFNWLPRRLDGDDPLRPVSLRVARLSVWPYVLAGAISWIGVQRAGLMPALGLLPIIPAIPHANHAYGAFSEAETVMRDMLNRLAHWLVWPVSLILFLFAVTHAGVAVAAADHESLAVLAALLLGKPLGVVGGGWLALRFTKAELPRGMRIEHLGLVGMVAAMGLTVPLLVLGPTIPPGVVQDGARLGLILSLIAAPLALAAARLGHLAVVRRQR